MTDNYKHILEVASRFNKSVKCLNESVKKQLKKKIEELLNGQHGGKALKSTYREFKAVRIGKYRLIYNDKEPCKIVLHDIRHRETAYKRFCWLFLVYSWYSFCLFIMFKVGIVASINIF